MKSHVTIVPGKSSYHSAASALIYDSSHELMDFMFENRATAENTLGKLYQYQQGHFSHRFSTVVLQDDQVIGLQLGYDRGQLAKQELMGSLLLFLKSPAKRWWPLIRIVGPILDKYVPKPTRGAYYINNIAVSSTLRGGGLGKLLLAHTLQSAKQLGYARVELDVTAVNDAAIQFYERNGFASTSIAGIDSLFETHGLPPLVRMTHIL